MDLTEFLTARWDEEQRTAEAAAVQVENLVGRPRDCTDWELLAEDFERRMINWSEAVADHVELHSPARTLAEIEAKSTILAIHAPFYEYSDAEKKYPLCSRCEDGVQRLVAFPCETTLALVQLYRSHPDFDPTWSVPT